MRADVAALAARHFDPHRWQSGTERVAPLLYALVRMVRPERVVECGAGYSTLFLLAALEENADDFAAERLALVDKTSRLGVLERADSASWRHPLFRRWFGYPGRASAANASYYLQAHEPHLYCFDESAASAPYVQKLQQAAAAAGLARRLTVLAGGTIDPERLPAKAAPVQMVWWDAGRYDDCLRMFWPLLDPAGGLMVLHNVASGVMSNWEAFERAIAGHREAIAVVVLRQPDKLDQNSCAVLQRVDGCSPAIVDAGAERQLADARRLRDG